MLRALVMAAISPLLAESVRRSDRIGQSRSPAVLGSRWRSWQRSIEPIALITGRGIKPLLKDPMIEFIGEIGDSDRGAFLGDAMRCSFRSIGPNRSALC